MNVSRRSFLQTAGAASMLMLQSSLAGAALGSGATKPAPAAKPWRGARVRVLTRGPRHHFFGYYGMSPWNRSGRKLVCLESTFQDRMPKPDESAGVGLIDVASGKFERLTETHAWNFQQGTMFHWNPLNPENEVLFNDIHEGVPACAKLDITTGKKTFLPMPLAGVGSTGRYALGLSYGRLARLRPLIGYAGAKDPFPHDKHPDGDGVYRMDLATGEVKLILSLGEVYRRLAGRHPELKDRDLFFNHTVLNKSDSRFLVLARAFGNGRLETGMFTANLDGSELREVIPYGKTVSHFDWRNDREIVATYSVEGRMRHVLFTDGAQDHRVIGGDNLMDDGHCTFAPDQDWMVTDRNHHERIAKSLLLYNVRTGDFLTLGEFPMREMRYTYGDLRCDLHPRWKASGDQICFDALDHEGLRQVHVAELHV